MAISNADFEAATHRAEELRKRHSYAVKAYYDQVRNRIVIELANGLEIAFDPRCAQWLEDATAAQLEAVEITPGGLGLYFPRCDADFYLPALLEGLFGTRAWMAARLGSEGGKAKTPAKQKASRNNGKLGGRPRKCACA
jgi:hypothetical protein